MKTKAILITVAGLFIFSSLVWAVQEMGAENIVIPGGSSGPVPFPHKKHQEALKDCNLCHDSFAQESGIITRLKEEGTLKQKQIMNTQCLKCHRDTKKAGQPSGPTSCTVCHQK